MSSERLLKRIQIIKGVILCLNVITWIVAIVIIGLSLWLRLDSDIQDWVDKLEISSFYIGLYILMISSVFIFILGFVSCLAAVSENLTLLAANVVIQMLIFLLGLAGAAVLLANSTYKSSIHPVIKSVMLRLITLYPANDEATSALAILQENIGCCGAEGSDDYISLRRALPTQCRDVVTGNAYYYGCADELTWFLEQRSSWLTGLVILICCKKVVNAVLSTILIQLISKEEKVSRS